MKRAIRTWLALFTLCAGMPVSAQPLEPHLMPIDSDLAVFESLRPYKLAVREHLLGRAAGLSVLVFPSFQKEWAVQIAHDRGQPFVLYAVMDAQLWGALQERVEQETVPDAEVLRTLRVPVTRHTATLTKDTAQVVGAAWAAMLSASRRPAESRRILDGTSYLFFGPGPRQGQRVGLARSPEIGTPVAALAELVEALRHHVESATSASAPSEAVILRRANDVLAKARAAASSHAPPNKALNLTSARWSGRRARAA